MFKCSHAFFAVICGCSLGKGIKPKYSGNAWSTQKKELRRRVTISESIIYPSSRGPEVHVKEEDAVVK